MVSNNGGEDVAELDETLALLNQANARLVAERQPAASGEISLTRNTYRMTKAD